MTAAREWSSARRETVATLAMWAFMLLAVGQLFYFFYWLGRPGEAVESQVLNLTAGIAWILLALAARIGRRPV